MHNLLIIISWNKKNVISFIPPNIRQVFDHVSLMILAPPLMTSHVNCTFPLPKLYSCSSSENISKFFNKLWGSRMDHTRDLHLSFGPQRFVLCVPLTIFGWRFASIIVVVAVLYHKFPITFSHSPISCATKQTLKSYSCFNHNCISYV